MHRIVAAVWVALLGVALASEHAYAQLDFSRDSTSVDNPFELRADELEYESERELYVARGDVQITQGAIGIRADWVSFSRIGGRGVASGNVVYTDGQDTLYASFVEFNLTTFQGVLFLVRFDDSKTQFRVHGDEVLKTGERDYIVKRGSFTSCRCPEDEREPWKIRAAHTDLELGEYAVSRNSTLNVLGVPVLWLPWIAYSVDTDRKTGFLFPEVGYQKRSGYKVGLPFFWAVAPRVNLILTPRWVEKRGIKGEAYAKYVVGDDSSGSLFTAYIDDDQIDERSLDQPFDRKRWIGQGTHRWIAKGEQDFYLPRDWRLKSDFALISDNQYPADFRDLAGRQRDRYITSNVFATVHLGRGRRFGWVGSALIADDIQSPDEQDRDPYLLHRLPNVEFTALPARLPFAPRLAPSLDLEYTYFAQYQNPNEIFESGLSANGTFYDVGIDALSDRHEGATVGNPDPHGDNTGPDGDGLFQEGEPLADQGHRLLVHPRLAVPFRIGPSVEVYPEVGWRQALYQTRSQNFEAWGVVTARADIRSRLKRSYGDVTHILEPRLGYALVAGRNRGGRPFFVPDTAVPQRRIRQFDLDNVTRDVADLLDRFSGVTWGVGNRFYSRQDGETGARLLADVSLAGLFDFTNGNLGWLVADALLHPSNNLDTRFNFGFDLEEFRTEEFLGRIQWSGFSRLTAALHYRYLRTIPRFFEDFRSSDNRFHDFEKGFNRVNQASVQLGLRLTRGWSARWQLGYSFQSSLVLDHRASLEYLSRCDCWALGVEARQRRELGLGFNVLFRFLGLGGNSSAVGIGSLTDMGFLDEF